MKKRILSMLLAVITVVAMIPAALVTAIAAEATTPKTDYKDSYQAYVCHYEPNFDGKLDNIYLESEKISVEPSVTAIGGSYNKDKAASFEGYPLITKKGLYIFVTVEDATINQGLESSCDPGDGDKFQVYVQLANTVGGTTQWASGYFDMDYTHTNISVAGDIVSGKASHKYIINETGYTMEFFMPWEGSTNTINSTITPNTVDVYIGLQVVDWTVDAKDQNGNKTVTKYSVIYSDSNCRYYYNTVYQDSTTNQAPTSLMYPVKNIGYYDDYNVYVSETAPQIDGRMDDVYSLSEKVVNQHNLNGGVDFEAYALATKEGLYLFVSVIDTSKEEFEAVINGDKVQLYLQLANTNAEGKVEWACGYFEMDYSHVKSNNKEGTSRLHDFPDSCHREVEGTFTENVGYTVEFYLQWKDCAKIFSGDSVSPETLNMYFGVQVNNSNENASSGNLGIGYDNNDCQWYWHDGGGDTYNYYGTNGGEPVDKMTKANWVTEAGNSGHYNGYDTIVAVPEQLKTDNDSTPHVDGRCDDIYLSSEKIVPNYYYWHGGKSCTDVYFEIYTVATEEGLYVWAEITDSTVDAEKEASYSNSDQGDKLQICLEVENRTKSLSKWGCFDIDYSGKGIYYASRGNYSSDNCTPEFTTKTVDGGWVAEFFISWSDAIGDCDFSEISAYVGFQVNNYGGKNSLPYGQAYDNVEAVYYYDKDAKSNKIDPIEHFIPLNFQYSGNQPLDNKGANIPAFKVYSFGESATNTIAMDGLRDEVYLKSQRISEKKVVGSGTGFDAYIVATDKGLYLYADIEDTTLNSSTDYIRFYLTDPVKANKNTVANPVNYVQLNFDKTTVTGQGVTVANVKCKTIAVKDAYRNSYGWTAELFVPWAAINNFSNEEMDTEKKPPYDCAVGISVTNGQNISYCSSTRTNWENTTFFDYGDIMDGGNVRPEYKIEEDPSKSYYIPLTYTERCPEVNNVFVTNKEIVLDGKLDDIYKQSSKIVSRAGFSDSIAQGLEMTAYYVATIDGLYVWAETNDSTMNNVHDNDANTGDMIQIYLDWTLNYRSHEITGATANDYRFNDKYFFGGWISVDYEGGISATNDMSTVKPYVKTAVEKYVNSSWDGKNTQTQYSGYAIETFIPWTDEIKDQLGVHANDIHMGIGIQFSDDRTYDYDETKIIEPYYLNSKGEKCDKNDPDVLKDDLGDPKDQRNEVERYGNEYRQYIVYDTADGGAYYGSYERVPDVNFIYDDDLVEYSRFVADKVQSVVVDGTNTDGEYDYASVVHANLAGSGVADDGDIMRVVTTDDAIYILIEVEDSTPSVVGNKFGNYLDYVDLGVNFGGRFTQMYTFNRSTGAPSWFVPDIDLSTARWWNYENAPKFENGYIACTNSETKWTYEIKIDLTAEDKEKIKAGTFYLGLAAQFLDSFDTNGNLSDGERNYKYTVNNSGIYLGDFVIGAQKVSGTLDYATLNNKNYPSELYKFSYFLLKNNDSRITGANVDLGKSINVNYYAYIDEPVKYKDNVYMKFTMNGKVAVVKGNLINANGTVDNNGSNYMFVFEGVAPQCMIDNIEAELYIAYIKDSSYKAEKLKYSVYENVNNIMKDHADLKDLVEALLHYGAAAQKYINYKTGKLANKGLDTPDYDGIYKAAVVANSDKNIGAANASIGAQFTALGVHHSNENRIYAKITITDKNVKVSDLTVTINGEKAELQEYDKANGVYIVYTKGIKVKGFDDPCTIVLAKGSNTQTLTYSINAYVKAKWSTSSSTTRDLARALFAYGAAAEAYKNA